MSNTNDGINEVSEFSNCHTPYSLAALVHMFILKENPRSKHPNAIFESMPVVWRTGKV